LDLERRSSISIEGSKVGILVLEVLASLGLTSGYLFVNVVKHFSYVKKCSSIAILMEPVLALAPVLYNFLLP
jgi:hypothetical protein